MDKCLSPLALAISSTLLINSNVWADGGASAAPGNIISFGQVSLGAPGTTGVNANGTNGASYTTQQTFTLSAGLAAQLAGSNGSNSDTGRAGGGGSGGVGGGSVFGAITIGGAGGESYIPGSANSSNGGNGGAVSNIRLIYEGATPLTFTGTPGGVGGQALSNAIETTGTSQIVGTTTSPFIDYGGSGNGGLGGGSILGAYSQGGAGGGGETDNVDLRITSNGGAGGDISNIEVDLRNITLNGANGGSGGNVGIREFNLNEPNKGAYSNAAGGTGSGGAGGGSVFGALSQGGSAGAAHFNQGSANHQTIGGAGGNLSNISVTLSQLTLNGNGSWGGHSGSWVYSPNLGPYSSSMGGMGSSGLGGGSVFGGVSLGGSGGVPFYFRNTPSNSSNATVNASGGAGGNITNVALYLNQVTLNGSGGGMGTVTYYSSHDPATNQTIISYPHGGLSAPGAGGGSIYAAYSLGGAAGAYYDYSGMLLGNNTIIANGGDGGETSFNRLVLNDVRLTSGRVLFGEIAPGYPFNPNGPSPTTGIGGNGTQTPAGGSVFGGYSAGGAGGYAVSPANATLSARGGNGGNASNNTIRIAGTSNIPRHVVGGFSQGGFANRNPSLEQHGIGGEAINNHITLIGTNLSIGGRLYGGASLNGGLPIAFVEEEGESFPIYTPDMLSNYAQLNNSKTFTGNTLNLEGYRGSVEGVYNFEHYNWTLPADVVNRDVIITIRGNDLVDLNNTQHTVAMLSDGNRLNENDEIVLISKAQGNHQPKRTEVLQGYFIIYDALLDINDADEFVLTIAGKEEQDPVVPPADPSANPPIIPIPKALPIPAGRLNPTSKALLEGRSTALAMVNHGANMVAEQLTECSTDIFAIADGGSSRYSTGSSVKVTDRRMAIGGRKCFELPNTSQIMLGVFAEHGTGNYHSRNQFAGVGKVRGHGDLRYTGGGLMLHMDYAGTGTGIDSAPVLASKDGLYVDAVLRAGQIKTDFASNQIVDAAGKRAEYKSKSHYASAMLGAGYAWNLDEQQQVDLYARYTWDRLASDKVEIGDDEVRFGTDHSSLLRVGTRYHYALTPAIAPYAGIAYEHEFDGKMSGKVFEFNIEQPELKGSSGMLEVGVSPLPFGNNSGWHLDAGVQGYAGTRKGVTGSVSVKYEF